MSQGSGDPFQLPSLVKSRYNASIQGKHQIWVFLRDGTEDLLLKADALLRDPYNMGIINVSHCSHGSTDPTVLMVLTLARFSRIAYPTARTVLMDRTVPMVLTARTVLTDHMVPTDLTVLMVLTALTARWFARLAWFARLGVLMDARFSRFHGQW